MTDPRMKQLDEYAEWLLEYGRKLDLQSPLSREIRSWVETYLTKPSPTNRDILKTVIDDYCRSHPQCEKPGAFKCFV